MVNKSHLIFVLAVLFALLCGIGTSRFLKTHQQQDISQSKSSTTSSGEVTPLYFLSGRVGSTTTQCSAASNIDWKLAIFALSDYMEYGPGATNKEDFGPAEIQQNFEENCERDMTIYDAAATPK